MATPRQIAANQRDAQLEGPVTEAGQAASRRNALKHGLCAKKEMTEVEKGEFAKAWDEWRPYYDLPRPEHELAFHRMILASVRLKLCRVEEEKIVRFDIERAATRWDEDRRARADAMGRQLGRHPESVAKRLELSRHGVEWLIERWGILAARLEEQGQWTEAQVAMVHDLHGLPPALRPETPNFVDPGQMVARQVARLEGLKARSLDKLDAMERQDAMEGTPVEPSAAMRRLRHNEQALQREYDEQAAFLHKDRTWPPNERADKWTCPGCGKAPAPVYEPEPEPAPEQGTQKAIGQGEPVELPPGPDGGWEIAPPPAPVGVRAWTSGDAPGAKLRTKGSHGLFVE